MTQSSQMGRISMSQSHSSGLKSRLFNALGFQVNSMDQSGGGAI